MKNSVSNILSGICLLIGSICMFYVVVVLIFLVVGLSGDSFAALPSLYWLFPIFAYGISTLTVVYLHERHTLLYTLPFAMLLPFVIAFIFWGAAFGIEAIGLDAGKGFLFSILSGVVCVVLIRPLNKLALKTCNQFDHLTKTKIFFILMVLNFKQKCTLKFFG